MSQRHLLWGRLPDQRPLRELYWLSQMPDTTVTEVGSPRTHPEASGIRHIDLPIRRPVRRFVEAGAFGWVRGVGRLDPTGVDWVASLELCALVTGQLSAWAQRHRVRQAVVTWENMANQPLYRIPPYRQATRRALGADLMVCPIDAARDHLLELGFPADRISVVPPGIPLDIFRPAEALGVERDPNRIVFVSPLAENKGIDRVLEAFDIVRGARPDTVLSVAGRGPLEEMVRERAADPRSGITYHGSLDRSGVARLLAGSGVFTTAPRPTWKWNEQFGLAYLEAMACGLPIVTTVCGTNHEAVRPPNVRTADRAGPLADALLAFLDNPGLGREVGRHNRKVAEGHHDLQRQVLRLGEAFRQAERLPVRDRRRGGRPR
jgi:glycosyltransferase involved in cell wall biosynthesis